jgi:ribonuclease E
MKDALKNDRARIQVGRISHFGLLEMSRQRIRTGVLEGSTVVCPHCLGAGVVRSTASVALHVLRVLEDALIKSAAHDMAVRARTPVALYILNQKRAHLHDLERRFGVAITVEADDTLTGSNTHAIERGEPASGAKAEEAARESEVRPAGYGAAPADVEEFAIEEEAEAEAAEGGEGEASEEGMEGAEPARGDGEAGAGEGEPGRRRRRRRRRRGGERPAAEGVVADMPQPTDAGLAAVAEIGGDFSAAAPPRAESESGEEEEGRAPGVRRRRARRGRRGERDRFAPPSAESSAPEAGEPSASSVFENELAPLSAAEPEALTTAVSNATDQRIAAEPAAPSAAPRTAESVGAEANEPPAAASAETPAADDPSRPRRSGWWQRARATLVGEE